MNCSMFNFDYYTTTLLVCYAIPLTLHSPTNDGKRPSVSVSTNNCHTRQLNTSFTTHKN